MPDFRGRLSAQSQVDERVRALETKQVVKQVQTANFSARGNSSYIVEAPASNLMIVVLPPAVPSNRNDEIVFMHRNARTVRYVNLDGLVNQVASVNVSGIGLQRFVSDGQTGWYAAQTSAGTTVVAGNSLAFSGTTLNYTGTNSILTLAGITGAQGTVDISTIVCGGTVAVSAPVGNWSISGFTSTPTKPDGFWFCLSTPNGAFTGTLIEDAVAVVGDRLRMTGAADFTSLGLQAIIYKTPSLLAGSPRWRCVIGSPNPSAGGLTQDQVLNLVAFRA